MSKLDMSELNGQQLFSDSESFLNELSEHELMEIVGGQEYSNSSIGCAIQGSIKSAVYTVSQATALTKNLYDQGTVLYNPDNTPSPGSAFTDAGSYSFGAPGTF